MGGTIVCMRGPSGSGKSSVAHALKTSLMFKKDKEPCLIRNPNVRKAFDKEFTNSFTFSADSFFVQIRDGQPRYVFDPAKIAEAHKECYSKFVNAVVAYNKHLVFIDNTNLRAWEIQPYFMMAQYLESDFVIMEVFKDPYLAACQNQHDLYIEDVYKQYLNRESLPPHLWAYWEPYTPFSHTDIVRQEN